MTIKVRTCTRCGTETDTFCPVCIKEYENRRDVSEMTKQEKLDEWDSWGPILEIPFASLQNRLEELAGRGIWTHELAHPENVRKEIEAS